VSNASEKDQAASRSTRHFFAAALACALIFPTLARSAAAVPSADIAKRDLKPSDFPRWQQLVPNVYAYEGLHSADADGTVINTVSLIVVTADGVTVVDGQGDVPQTQLMIANIRKLTSQPIKYVVIASDHGDHVGGNAEFRAAYPNVAFISSPVSQQHLAKNANPPTQTVADKRTIRMGETDIQLLNLGRAHTGGDLAVYLPQSKVLFMSEIYLRDVFPAMRSAYPTEWVAAIEKAQAMDVSWYVPGHGFIDDRTAMKHDLAEARKALVYVIAEATRLHAAGRLCESPKNCPAAQEAQWGPYGDWALSNSQAPVAIAKIYQEIAGTLPR
jgi:glyoxylase-like metal-dependent hydrolase (beta-lactamase superfamily II)